MRKVLALLLIGVMLFTFVGCKGSHRRVTIVAHGHYGHRCGGHCSHYRPVFRSPVVIISHGRSGHHCGNHCSHYRPSHRPVVIHKPTIHRSPVIVHRPAYRPPVTIHSRPGTGRGKISTRVYKMPPMGPRSHGSIGRQGIGRGPSSTNRPSRGSSSRSRGQGASRGRGSK